MGIGETYEVEITPEAVGTMRLEVRLGPPWPAPSVHMATLPITVGHVPQDPTPPRPLASPRSRSKGTSGR
jgi:hypothetical protein